LGSILPASRSDGHDQRPTAQFTIALPALSFSRRRDNRAGPPSTGPHIAQGSEHHATKKENAMDFGLILIATNTLMALFIFFILNLIWKQ
jgi:hypothetical protein